MESRANTSASLLSGRSKWYFLALTLLFVVGIGGGTWSYSRHRHTQARRSAEIALATIADLKAGEIASWMKERRGDAELARSSVAVQQLLKNPDNPGARAAVRQVIAVFQQVYHYDAVAVFDAHGTPLVVMPDDGLRPYASITNEVKAALQARDVIFADLHQDGPTEPIHLTLLCPLRIDPDTSQSVDGAILLVIDPRHFLYPLVQSWPAPSETAETVLIRRDGDDILYLNELRHRQDAALKLRLPAKTESTLPALTAVQGVEGVFEGTDYRGVPTLAATRKIQGTPWFMVAKMDQSEIYASVRKDVLMVATTITLMMLTAALGLGLLLRQQKLVYAQKQLTELKRAEESLQKSETKFRALFENAGDAIFLFNNDRYIDCNIRALEMFGCRTHDEILGRTPSDFSPPFQPNGQNSRELVKAKIAEASAGQPLFFEWNHTRLDGSVFPAEITFNSFQLGDRVVLQAIVRDITERKRAEEELLRLSAAIQQAAEAIMITDTAGTILYVNPAFERTSGHLRDEAIGRTPSIVKSGKHDDGFYQKMWHTLTRGEVWKGRLVNKRKDGKLYEEDATISPVRDASGKVVNYMAINLDVSREVELEAQFRQAQKMEGIGQLAGGVAHDFNNILAAIMMQSGLTEMAKGLPEEARTSLRTIHSLAERAGSLTRQLLLFSRKQVLQLRDLDLNESIINIAKMLQRIIGEDVRLHLNLCPGSLLIHADPGMIDQILMNLVVNARDAMPTGGNIIVETAVRTLTAEEAAGIPDASPGPYVSLRVIDTGCGIAPDILPRIFEPFFTTKAPGKGTGLGLATVFGIVKQHAGVISVESTVERGTAFQVLFRRVEARTSQQQSAAEPTSTRGTGTILLVEDETTLRQLTRATLESAGYRVLEAGSGVKALRLWEEHQDDIRLLLTDVIMPDGLNGRELAETLQASKPKLSIIFISGYSADRGGHELVLQPEQGFLQKPFSPYQLLDAVRQSLGSQPV